MSDNKENQEVEMFQRVNRLKIKAGSSADGPPVKFSKERLENPKKFMEQYTANYDEQFQEVLTHLEAAWKDLLSKDPETRNKGREALYHRANHAKDLAATCDYPLMKHFGLSLREFVEDINPESKAHQTIVRAHMDVMNVTHKENIQDDGGDKAQELKKMIKLAIDKFGE